MRPINDKVKSVTAAGGVMAGTRPENFSISQPEDQWSTSSNQPGFSHQGSACVRVCGGCT